jgi:hypothetical protein
LHSRARRPRRRDMREWAHDQPCACALGEPDTRKQQRAIGEAGCMHQVYPARNTASQLA